MFVHKSLIGLVALLSITLAMAAPGALDTSAKTSEQLKPLETEETIEVELDDDYFKPEVITIPNGKTTELLLKNEGKKEHTFTVEKLGIDVEVQPGEEKTVTVKPEASGTYELICRYHVKEGMVGKVIVQ
ncbi:cupredoxin domain-containing protein [Ornithinibacillus californiensis]|uniref:cupredoxin domain-containing protein n=1 Tax=Ornithinibacillus californiensis TaxID=161536 RepID=UPI00064D8256|nr:cupredoxin domain-containing protein [Ornithinibacillus californiensis]